MTSSSAGEDMDDEFLLFLLFLLVGGVGGGIVMVPLGAWSERYLVDKSDWLIGLL